MLPFLALLPLGKKIIQSKVAKNVFKGVGRVFKKKNKGAGRAAPANSGIVGIGALAAQPTASLVDAPRNVSLGLVGDDEKGGNSLPDKINDWLGTATKTSRQIETNVSVDNGTKVFVGALVVIILGYFLVKK